MVPVPTSKPVSPRDLTYIEHGIHTTPLQSSQYTAQHHNMKHATHYRKVSKYNLLTAHNYISFYSDNWLKIKIIVWDRI
jgi:hypothetical protein